MKAIAPAPLAGDITVPQYDRRQLKTRIVHFGSDAFHRAYQASLTDKVLNTQSGDWDIRETGLFSGGQLINQLRGQDYLSIVLRKGTNGNQLIAVGAASEYLNAKPDLLATIIEKFCRPQMAIILLAITEKGYCADPATDLLDLSNPRITHGLQTPTEPYPAPGVIVETLHRQRECEPQPSIILSYNNIPDNSHVVKNAVLGMAEKCSSELTTQIQEYVSSPGTMIDCIVPITTGELLVEIACELGITDPCVTSYEPFIWWVTRDNLACGHPQWGTTDVQMVESVLPWEQMKLRTLNDSHSFLVYLGYLAGFRYISDCIQSNAFREAAYRLMLNEQTLTL